MNQTRRRIILIEDDDDHAEIMAFHLHEQDPTISVTRLEDGGRAMAWVEASAALEPQDALPWLVLLDLKLPRYDGHEVLSHLRRHPRLATLPVVVCSTSDASRDVTRALALGANAFVTKPSALDGFARLVEGLLGFWRFSAHERADPRGLT